MAAGRAPPLPQALPLDAVDHAGPHANKLKDEVKAKLTECSAAETCGELEACFTKHRCQFMETSPHPGRERDFVCI